jgi:hypothetical protein
VSQPLFRKRWQGPVFVAVLVLFAIFAILFAFQIDPLPAAVWSAIGSIVGGLIASIFYGLFEGIAAYDTLRSQQQDLSEKPAASSRSLVSDPAERRRVP